MLVKITQDIGPFHAGTVVDAAVNSTNTQACCFDAADLYWTIFHFEKIIAEAPKAEREVHIIRAGLAEIFGQKVKSMNVDFRDE